MPKKKGGKKANQDDWEADLGDPIDPIAEAAKQAKEEAAEHDGDDEQATGGLLAALNKNRDRKKKKGRVVEDYVQGEDPTEQQTNTGVSLATVDLAAKVPLEANADDEDTFEQPRRKGQAGKAAPSTPDQEDDEDEEDAGTRMKTKKEKEKEKKEKEKQRKKEQVQLQHTPTRYDDANLV